MKSFITFFVTALFLSFSVSSAPAVVTSGAWLLNQSNTFPDNVDYGTVAITADDVTGLVQFTVTALDNPSYNASGANFGIQSFGFNFANLSAPNTWTSLTLPGGWSQDNNGGTMSGFGNFMVTEDGTGNSRQNPLAFSFVLPDASQAITSNFEVLSSGNAGEGNVFFAAHVAGFTDGIATSHFIGGSTVVPAPGAVVLGLIGLWLIGRIKRLKL